jgi:phosphoenolpyruvate synthase/pyruvate phosphate dikinase
MPALSPEQVSRVATTAIDLANRLGFQADFEGGISGGEVFFFQARPITTLG